MVGIDLKKWRCEALADHLMEWIADYALIEDELDLVAGLLLEGDDGLADRLVLPGVPAILPPDDKVGRPGAQRRQREGGGDQGGSDHHGAASLTGRPSGYFKPALRRPFNSSVVAAFSVGLRYCSSS